MQYPIVIEGIDNSGKSTLVDYIKKDWPQMQIQRGEGPPREGENINDRIRKYAGYEGQWLFDRHPVISQPIYACINPDVQLVEAEETAKFYASRPFIVYCDPGDRGLGEHKARTGEGHIDTPEFLAGLERNYQVMLGQYRTWALQHAHVIYRIGDSQRFIADLVACFIRFKY